MSKAKQPAEVIIAEAAGYAGPSAGLSGAALEQAMSQAVLDCMAAGVTDDTPPERVHELTGVEGKGGAEFIRDAKLAARQRVKDEHRAATVAYEAEIAAALAADAAPGE